MNSKPSVSILFSSCYQNLFLSEYFTSFLNDNPEIIKLFDSAYASFPFSGDTPLDLENVSQIFARKFPYIQPIFMPDKGINESILYALKFITTDYVFFCVDDRIISSLCLKQFNEAIKQAISLNVNSLRLNNCGEHSLRSNATIGPLLKVCKYRVSFTNTLFKVSFLRFILSSGKTLWQLEASLPDEFNLKHYAPSYRFLVNPIVSQIHLIRRRKIISLSLIGSKIILENKLPRASLLFCLYQHAHSIIYPGLSTFFALCCIFCRKAS